MIPSGPIFRNLNYFRQNIWRLYSFQLRDDDIWIVTFPKAGTTWTQEMVWMLVNDVDKEKGAVPASLRCPYMEINSLMGPDLDKIPFPPDMIEAMNDPIGYAGKMSSPRVLKTHLPIDSLPNGMIYSVSQGYDLASTRCPRAL